MKFVCIKCGNIIDEKETIIQTGNRIRCFCRKCYAQEKEEPSETLPDCFGQYISNDKICAVCKYKEECRDNREEGGY